MLRFIVFACEENSRVATSERRLFVYPLRVVMPICVMLYRMLFSSLLYVVHTQPTSTQSLIMSGAREIKFGIVLAKAPFRVVGPIEEKFSS